MKQKRKQKQKQFKMGLEKRSLRTPKIKSRFRTECCATLTFSCISSCMRRSSVSCSCLRRSSWFWWLAFSSWRRSCRTSSSCSNRKSNISYSTSSAVLFLSFSFKQKEYACSSENKLHCDCFLLPHQLAATFQLQDLRQPHSIFKR